MKTFPTYAVLTLFATICIYSTQLFSQTFQRVYGTALDNSFSKVVQDNSGSYYIIGQDEAVNGTLQRATVTRLDSNGIHQWTLGLNFASIWHDAVLTPAGDLMLVGQTLPSDPTSKGIMARVTPAGAFVKLRTYDEQGRDLFTRIVNHGGSFPYYVIGAQFESGGTPTTEDVVLFNMDQDLNINWKKRYFNGGDDEYFRDLEVLNGSELLMAGNRSMGVIFKSDNNGNISAGVQLPDRFVRDVHREVFGGFYAAATNFGNSEAYVEKFDPDMLLVWEYRIDGLTSISQVWEGLPGSGELLATGMGNFGGQTRTVMVKLLETSNGLTVDWVKYLTVGNGYVGGSAWFLPSVQIAFTDARQIPGGFGQNCAYLSVSDLELGTCEVETTTTTLTQTDPFPNSPDPLPIAEMPLATVGVNVIESSALNWQQHVACSVDPCAVNITVTPITPGCGQVQVCAVTTGPGPHAFQWCNGSTSQCYVAQLTPCVPQDFCVSVTCADGTLATATLVYTLTDGTPPVASCIGIGVVLDANCSATITPSQIDGGSTDDCGIASMTVTPSMVTGCGLHPVTLTVTDYCGNHSSCSTMVQAIEEIPPTIVCPPSKSLACDANTGPNNCGTATATDNCDPSPAISYTESINGQMPCDGIIVRTWKAEDICGNVSTCVQTISVIDNVPPTLTNCPQNLTVTGSFNAVGLCEANVQIASPTATDNCDQNVSLTNSFNNTANASGTYQLGTTTVTWTATDDCGRKATCTFTVTVVCDNPNDFPGLHCGQAVVTCFSGFNSPASYWSGVNQNAPVLAIVDVRDHSTATPGTWWTTASASEYSHPTWTPQNLGQIFGIAIDQNDDIYVTATTIYTCNTTTPFAYNPFTSAGPGAIYKVNGVTGAVTNYITTGAFSAGGTTIPNNGSAIGDIGYDALHDQFFITNHADGKIYRIKNGLVMSRFDPFGSVNPPASGTGSDPSFVALGERTWGVAYYNGRVYFSRWAEDIGRQDPTASNEIWSIGLDGAGEFNATNLGGGNWENGEALEITLPCYPVSSNWSNPVSDIAFSTAGRMLLAERTISSDCGGAFTTNWFGYAHSSRLLEYEFTGSWNLTPGHVTSVCGSNTNLKFTTGAATATYDNSAGGVDYGYASFDPATTTQPDCDKFVWNTGDGLHPNTSYNTYCSQPGNTWLYGMQGFQATGGTNSNSLLIDFDNDVCTYDKILLGDVEILKCGCINTDPDFPCDSLWVSKDSINFNPGEHGDTCCWDLDFHVHTGPLAYMEVESLTPGVIFNNPSLSSNFQWGGTPTGTYLPISNASPGHGIPQGDYNSALKFCLGNILTPAQDTQCVVFRWYVFGPTDVPYLACTDTCYFHCPPPIYGDTCLIVKNDSVACNPDRPLEYCYFFSAQNLSGFTASQVVLSNPTPGFGFKPCPPPNIPFTSSTIALPNQALNPGVAPDSCFPQMCVKIVATAPIVTPTKFCFEAGMSSNDSCCHSAIEHCIVLVPCCDPCEDRGVVVHTVPPVDSCCHSLDITNDCNQQFFTKLELQLLTSGVIFGSHSTGGPNPGDWLNPISTNNLIQWQHVSGFVPSGTTPGLINFCLDEINMPSEVPQTVVLNWLTTGSDGKDSVACSDTLIFDCPAVDNKCVDVLEQHIECVEDANGNVYYQLTMIIQNVSNPPHTANEVIFTQLGGNPVTIFPNPIPISPLPPNGITTITTNIFGSGLNIGDKLIFEVRLHSLYSNDNWCCFEGDSICVFIPDCNGCHCAPPSLTMTTTVGGSFPLTCNVTDPALWPSLPCQSGSVTISGNIGCTGNMPGTNCPPSITWSLTGPSGPIASGTLTNGAILQTFTSAQVSAPGTYTFVTTTLCPGAGEACACYINWVQQPCGQQCFCAPADLVVMQGSTSLPLSCTQGAPTPVLPCPAADVTVFGLFGCTSTTGAPCPPTGVNWSLTGPNGFIVSGTEPSNSISLTFPQAQVTAAGTYFLTVSTLCPGAVDSCICTVRWIRENCDTCCQSFDAFCALVAQGFTVVTDPALCKATLTSPQFNDCHWFSTPPHLQGEGALQVITDPDGMWMFNFAQSGAYTVCVNVFEENANGEICWQKEMCTTFEISCSTGCQCGTFTNMNWLPVQGAPNQPIICGDMVTIGCLPAGADVNFGGNFNCIGNNCPPSVVNWVLREKVSQNVVLSGTTNGPSFQVSIPSSSFVFPKVYELIFTGACNGVVCDQCVFMIATTECPCHCGMFDQIKLVNKKTGLSQIMVCNNQPTVALTCPPLGKPYKITGKLNCTPTSCGGTQLHWELKDKTTGMVVASGNQPGPWFSITLDKNALAGLNGLYDLVLTGMCGTDICTCVLHFDIGGCPMPVLCPCDNDFVNHVSAGFSFVYDFTNGCRAVLTPSQLTECDKVAWAVQGQNVSFNLTGSTTGNQPFTITPPTNTIGNYKVWMKVTRPNTTCDLTFCQYITINCLVVGGGDGICTDNEIGNPGFNIMSTPGILGTTGTTEGWTARLGAPELLGGDGCSDPFSIKIIGKCLPILVDVIDHPLTPSQQSGVKVSACYKMANEDWRPGTELVIRLSIDQQNGITCEGECVEIVRIPITSPTGNNWQTAFATALRDNLDLYKFLTIHLENDLTYDNLDANSIILLDNICFEQNDSAQVTSIVKNVFDDAKIRLFPNPTFNSLTLEFVGEIPKDGAMQVLDIYGRLHLTDALKPGEQKHQFSVAALPAGMYFLRVTDGGVPVWTEKVVKE